VQAVGRVPVLYFEGPNQDAHISHPVTNLTGCLELDVTVGMLFESGQLGPKTYELVTIRHTNDLPHNDSPQSNNDSPQLNNDSPQLNNDSPQYDYRSNNDFLVINKLVPFVLII
jgi:hypothetical protein